MVARAATLKLGITKFLMETLFRNFPAIYQDNSGGHLLNFRSHPSRPTDFAAFSRQWRRRDHAITRHNPTKPY
jgi:hypothetical protein